MAVDRVNLVREGFEAWNAEDPRWVLEHMSPEVEWVAPERDPFPGTYKGLERVQEFWTRWRNAVGQLTSGAGAEAAATSRLRHRRRRLLRHRR